MKKEQIAHIYMSEWDFEWNNPEPDFPSDMIATSYYVTVANEHGNTWHHDWTLQSHKVNRFECIERVEKMIARIKNNLDAGGSLNMDHWSEGTPMYGSEAWRSYEREEIAPYADALNRGSIHVEDLPDSVRGYF